MPRWLAFGIAALWSAGAHAALVTYVFEDAPLGAATPLALTEQGLTASFAGPVDPDTFEVSYNVAGVLGPTYATLSGAFLTVGQAFGAPGSALTITFGAAIRSLSLVFALDDPGATGTTLTATADGGLTAAAGGAITPGFSYPEGVLVLDGGYFTSVTLSSDALDFSLDDIVVDTPEPGSLLLGLPALALLALYRPRRA